ncbi:probable NMA2 - nicotinate-nucleotide adenylyltransferase [Melanopsichium pennsylvanicum]|uniref:Probable NMA2 - nicotinate-nucleotide adenylyltransferase n=2 Tax=Melanopsichium pennsylvanicum TaxID=63383 RepID=A0AAJ4XNK0_9BASI|nr:probable NMA2-nicotinate-nucleotide adenylyltransferase [Melanopsichium pennsylvanicum 4]SNX85624.1 probable NMA2 - nicotinate-nucleotide adenylyltransferase [Melanopsichium pennsylvanicum]
MTDSQAGPGGPSSLKFAALSVQSFHLDSPPFTGAAVGGAGPLDEAGQRLSSHDSDPLSHSSDSSLHHHPDSPLRNGRQTSKAGTSSPLSRAKIVNGEDQDPYTRSMSQARSLPPSSSQHDSSLRTPTTERQSLLDGMTTSTDASDASASKQARSNDSTEANTQTQSHYDRDVPKWDLDEKLSSRDASAASLATLSPKKPVACLTSSESATSADRPDTSRNRAPSGWTQRTNSGQSARNRASPTRAASGDRPSYSQFSEDLDAQEDAGSSAAERDDEVDGVEGLSPDVRLRDGRVPQQGQTKEDYGFPRHRLPTKMRDETKTPLVIVACGSFSPPTYLHLRIFEMAKDQINESGKYELLAGYYSPVSDYYKKEGLAKATHRVRMCELAVEKTSTWLMVDAWESLQDEYQRTAVVLDHFHEEINGPNNGGVLLSDGTRKNVKIMLLAGGDLIQSMGEPGIWATADLHHILGQYGCLIVERTGADVWSFLLSHDLLWKYRRNLKIVKQTIYNDISSSKVRLFVRRGQSIKYLLPNSVIQYIEHQGLYRLPPDEDLKSEPEHPNW